MGARRPQRRGIWWNVVIPSRGVRRKSLFSAHLQEENGDVNVPFLGRGVGARFPILAAENGGCRCDRPMELGNFFFPEPRS